MRFVILIVCMLSFINYAVPANVNNVNKIPNGIFRKTITGKYVQYDKNGKKIGTYKVTNGRCYKIK